MNFLNQLHIRQYDFEGYNQWIWPKDDVGAWSIPINDWLQHKDNYFTDLKNKRVCVTAGANCGLYTNVYANMFETVYAFEPEAINFHCMSGNNPFDNVIKMQAALGKENGFIEIEKYNSSNVGMHKVKEGVTGIIPIFSIDSFNFPVLDFLQLDVELYEGVVLEGARETIKRCEPVIVLENCKGHEILEENGYVLTKTSAMDNIFIKKEK